MAGLILPRIQRVVLSGFQPLFTDGIVELDLPDGPFLVLGGNALGKTTMLQAIIFAVAGEADSRVEDRTDLHWGAAYFKARLDNAVDAEVLVEFTLKSTVIAVRRRMSSKAVRGVQIDGKDWALESADAGERYEEAVRKFGGYTSFEDFRYLVHRLCYLGESRRSLLWDQAAQLRAVMLICGDAQMEREFRVLRATLKETDSEMRHAYGDIGKLQARLDQLTAAKKAKSKSGSNGAEDKAVVVAERSAELEASLAEISKERLVRRVTLTETRRTLGTTNAVLEQQQTALAEKSDAFVLEALRGVENASAALALHKLLVHELCPYCTQKSSRLAQTARNAVEQGNCPICEQLLSDAVSNDEIRALRAQISQHVERQDELQEILNTVTAEDADLLSREIEGRQRLDALVAKLPRVQFAEVSAVVGTSSSQVRDRLTVTRTHHARLEARKRNLEAELEEKYEQFSKLRARRLQQLGTLAAEYGTAFLSDPCEFVLAPSKQRLSPFSLFVPRFAEKNRESPDSCSESERFFLDIGFRMALLMLAGLLSTSRSTFVCETPENALDLAYTDNVASMFRKFSIDGFSILLTANLQLGGVAKPLLSAYRKTERRRRNLNLITKSDLSTVQNAKKTDFAAVYAQIVG
jgi:hypothetical protein